MNCHPKSKKVITRTKGKPASDSIWKVQKPEPVAEGNLSEIVNKITKFKHNTLPREPNRRGQHTENKRGGKKCINKIEESKQSHNLVNLFGPNKFTVSWKWKNFPEGTQQI